jgi:prepilin-type N-terminal cleavage/methylation domain-containing protein
MLFSQKISKNSGQSDNGFTLIESLVAISILLLAITGPLTLVTSSFFASFVARDQLVASYLVQDAIEYVRAVRDGNFLENIDTGTPVADWLDGHPVIDLTDCIADTCSVDTAAEEIDICVGDQCIVLYDSNTGVYGHNTGEDSIFTRTVQLTEVVPDEEYILEAVVSWNTGTSVKSVTAEEHIFNWLDFE